MRKPIRSIKANAWDVTFQLPIRKRPAGPVTTGTWWFKSCMVTGWNLTDVESDMIIDLLYDLRKGMEREAG